MRLRVHVFQIIQKQICVRQNSGKGRLRHVAAGVYGDMQAMLLAFGCKTFQHIDMA